MNIRVFFLIMGLLAFLILVFGFFFPKTFELSSIVVYIFLVAIITDVLVVIYVLSGFFLTDDVSFGVLLLALFFAAVVIAPAVLQYPHVMQILKSL